MRHKPANPPRKLPNRGCVTRQVTQPVRQESRPPKSSLRWFLSFCCLTRQDDWLDLTEIESQNRPPAAEAYLRADLYFITAGILGAG